eukprot:CAMPEP_0113454898 /NCGR_PEP_ID=MMETSP0014_2-20120614/8100_1 /TAXON_ID=2857 /ORGANISM="Nitzschia sp." /LENGTH=1874 /DNA_ID=CAMNT_0000346317 /DNA_START=2263 /DNA_END=7887 /DNA_ORIENTATION=- /assembly_acc=CAM_ASM_000159
MMQEIPLVFPSNAVDRPRRYFLDFIDTKRLIQLSTLSSSTGGGSDSGISSSNAQGRTTFSSYGGGDIMDDMNNMVGAASTSTIQWSSSKPNDNQLQALVTTSALVEEPSVISVSLSWYGGGDDREGPAQIELQLPKATTSMTDDTSFSGYDDSRSFDVVSIQAFADTNDDRTVKLVLVFRRGAIVTARFDEDLIPSLMDLQVAEPQQYLATAPALQERILSPGSQFELEHNRIGFIDSDRVVLAFPPDPTHALLTVHLPSGQGGVWSEAQCKEEMMTRTGGYSLTGFFNTILGTVDGQGNPDMPATSALCVASHSSLRGQSLLEMDSYEAQTTLIFTLHSDGSIRKWKIVKKNSDNGSGSSTGASTTSPADLLPMEVTSMDNESVEKFVLPNNTQWSDVRLAARIYNQKFYGLAVSIQTNQDDDDMFDAIAAEDDDYDEDTEQLYGGGMGRSCHLWTISGVDGEDKMECKSLRIPSNTLNLVGMSWVPTEERSTLSAVFQATAVKDSGDSSRILQYVTYAHSNVSIVSQQPHITETISLDEIAVQEKDRISSLNFGTVVLNHFEDEDAENGNMQTDDTTNEIVNKALHDLDTRYVRYLFRPVFPRGTGTVSSPSSSCILRAFSKLMHGSRKEYEMSIELETVKKIHEWRALDARKAAASRISPLKKKKSDASKSRISTGLSVYDEFVGDDEFDDENIDPLSGNIHNPADTSIDDAEEDVAMKLEAEVIAHDGRWRRLLLQVWEEEQVFRTPLSIFWLDDMPMQLIVRGGVTSAISLSDINDSSTGGEGWYRALDSAAHSLIWKIESDSGKSKALYAVEERMFSRVADGHIAVSTDISFSEELTSLARWARSRESINDNDINFERIIRERSVEELVAWAQSRPSGLGVPKAFNQSVVPTRTSGGTSIANSQTRLSVCSLTTIKLDSARRFALSRCLLLLELAGGSQATQASLRAYLRCLSVMWTSAQRAPMIEKPTARRIRFEGVDDSDNRSPPQKRSKSAPETVSILSPSEKRMTSVLDIVMIGASKKEATEPGNTHLFPGSTVMSLTDIFLCMMYPAIDTATGLTPELNILPSTQDVVLEHPKLSLRILSPYVTVVIDDDKPERVVARKEKLSACLLSIASLPMSSLSANRRFDMQQAACILLAPEAPELNNTDVDREMIRAGIAWLEKLREGDPSGKSITEMETTKWIEKLLGDKATRIEIKRVVEMSTTRLLFDPLSLSTTPSPQDISDMERASILKVAENMLRLSRLRNRLKILEKPIKSSSWGEENVGSLEMFLDLITDTIEEVESAFPSDFVGKMREYSTLWSMKFQCAVNARRWNEAYEACVRTPIDEHRQFNYKLLVENMIESGYLNRLLNMCTEVDVESLENPAGTATQNNTVDLYEVASEVMLRRTKPGDYYDLRASASDMIPVADYAGALYSLHASQENWRRATQALDLRYNAAVTSLTRAKSLVGPQSLAFNELREKVIMEDMVLSSCSSAHTIALVKDEADRFLVSGEYSPYTELPSAEEDANGGNASDISIDRLSRFMTESHLAGRAAKSISLRTLYLDRGIDVDFSGFLKPKISNEFVDALYSNGYIHYGNLLAEAQCKAFERLTNGSRGVGGDDLFVLTLTDLLTKYLIPLTVTTTDSKPARPTLPQLQAAIDTAGSIQKTQTFIATDRKSSLSSQQAVVMRTAASLLVKNITSSYSSSTASLAEALANSFLELNENAVLPVWLERMLVGADVSGSFVGVGTAAFAPRSMADFDGYAGNPQGLISIYISHGMLVEACNLVSEILSGFGTDDPHEFATKNSSRLPEKGDIDYVPYKNIDLVWNLIEIATKQNGNCPPEYKTRALAARDKMEQALKKYIENSRITEMGLQSARATARIVV